MSSRRAKDRRPGRAGTETVATFDFLQSLAGPRPPLLYEYKDSRIKERMIDGSVAVVKRYASVCTYDSEPFWKRSRGRKALEVDALCERGLFEHDDS